MKKLRSALFSNLPYKALSVLIALSLWFIVQDERVEETFSVALDVQTIPDLVMSNDHLPELSVGVSGTRAAIGRLRQSELVHTVKIHAKDPGLVTVRLRPEDLLLPGTAQAFHVSPASTIIRLEGKATRRIPIRPRVVLDSDGSWRISKVTVTPSAVEVAGPASVVTAMDEVWTEAIAVTPEGGEPVSGVHTVYLPHRQLELVDPDPITVRVEFEAVRAGIASTPVDGTGPGPVATDEESGTGNPDIPAPPAGETLDPAGLVESERL